MARMENHPGSNPGSAGAPLTFRHVGSGRPAACIGTSRTRSDELQDSDMIWIGNANRKAWSLTLPTVTFRPRLICWALAYPICAALSATALSAQPVGKLTHEDIDAAIKWGTQGSPAPYLLHHRRSDPAKANPVVVGAVYTPFLRVALAARAAHQRGHSFAVSDVPSSLIEPVAYVAVRWYCCVDRDHGDDLASWHPLVPFDYKIAVPGDRFPRPLNLVTPLWVSRDPLHLVEFWRRSAL
jgi:hypothetical protein